MDVAAQRLLLGRNARGQLLTGLRGVGKTVLLNEFERIADKHGYFHAHIEVTEDGRLPGRTPGRSARCCYKWIPDGASAIESVARSGS